MRVDKIRYLGPKHIRRVAYCVNVYINLELLSCIATMILAIMAILTFFGNMKKR